MQHCIMLYNILICAICVTIHNLVLHKGVWFIKCIICTHPALRSIYTQCVVLHTFLLLGPINFDSCYFVVKSVFVIYAFFGVNFILRKFCLCKRNDKYEVWIWRGFLFLKKGTGFGGNRPPYSQSPIGGQKPLVRLSNTFLKLFDSVALSLFVFLQITLRGASGLSKEKKMSFTSCSVFIVQQRCLNLVVDKT